MTMNYMPTAENLIR